MGLSKTIFRFLLLIAGLGLIALGTWVYEKNILLTAIGGLIMFISGIHIHLLTYQKDRNPEEIVQKIKDVVKQSK